MKRCYACAMAMLLCLLALPGFTRAQSGSISGMFFIDNNGDRRYNGAAGNEDGDLLLRNGATVELYRKDGQNYNIQASTATDADGRYAFHNLEDRNDYHVKFIIPVDKQNDYTFLKHQNDDPDMGYSDIETDDGYTVAIRVSNNNNHQVGDIDGGLKPKETPPQLGSIGNWVWLDENNNGTQDAGEIGLDNIYVELYKLNTSNQQYEAAGNVTTNNGGYYLFSNLASGSYYVQFTAPAGFIIGKKTGNIGQTDNSDADENGKTVNFSLAAGENNLNVDAAMRIQPPPPGSIGDEVWLDEDKDGLKGAKEHGVPDVFVDLYRIENGSPVWKAQKQTNGSGKYSFSDLVPGIYEVKFTLPDATYQFTQIVGVTNDDNNSDADIEGKVKNIIVISGENRVNIDAGIHLKDAPPATGSIGDLVWNDENGNGLQDESGNPGIPDVKVMLYTHVDNTDTKYDSTTTNGSGKYKFDKVPAGSYRIKFFLTTGYDHFTTKSGNLDDGNNSDADPSNNGFTDPFNLAAGEDRVNVDAGMIAEVIPPAKGSIGDIVWIDEDKDGLKGSGENGLKDVLVDLYMYQTGATDPVWKKQSTTNGSGKYQFSDLDAGTYQVKFTLPNGYEFTKMVGLQDDDDNSDADKNNSGKTKDIILSAGQNRVNIDAGLFVQVPDGNPNPQINGILWYDANGDGFQGGTSSEYGIGLWTVKLLGADKTTVLDTKTTDNTGIPGQQGRYSFTHLSAGTYYILFVKQSGYSFTYQNAANDNKDSDVDPQGYSEAIVITNNAQQEHVDAGVYLTEQPPTGNAKISGRLWDDTFDKDGIQDGLNNEPGMGGQTVELRLSDGTLYKTATTEPSGGSGVIGTYKFENVALGTYYVQFTLPSGFTFTLKDAGSNDQKDSDADRTTGKTDNISITTNAEITHIDAGAIKGGTRKGSIGNQVWFDKDCDGIQDLSENGEPYVNVRLYAYNDGHSDFLRETATNQYGLYSFSDLEAGTYRVRFMLPEDFERFTIKDAQGDHYDSKDSDADQDGWTDPITLSAGEDNIDIDAGMCKFIGKNACIGDFVWKDCNGNGIQDKDEPGIPNLRVELYKWDSNVPLKWTTTNSMGKYYFENVEPGSYYVKFMPASGMKFTLKDQGSNDALDSDADTKTGKTDKITLNGENNFTIDAGMVTDLSLLANLGDLVWNDCNRNGIQDVGESGIGGVEIKLHICTSSHTNPSDPCACGEVVATTKTDKNGKYMFTNILPGYYCLEIVVPCNFTITLPDKAEDFKDSDIIPSMKHTACIKLNPGETNLSVDAGLYPTPPATFGDFVWIDANKNGIQDKGEKGLCNVTVELYMCGVTKPVATTTTDNNGNYAFKNVTPNTSYSVKFYLPKGYTFTSLDQGGNDNFDSDVCPKNNGMTKFYDVLPDETNLTIDCGMYLATTSTCNYVWKDNNNNGVKDDGEAGIKDVTVELYQCSNNTLVQSVKTDATGLFTFKDILLESYYMKIIVPNGYKIGKSSPEGGAQGVDADFGTNGQSSCFDVTDGTTSIGKPIALVLSTTGITRGAEIPTEFTLQQNYPNPFNPSTTIEFAVPAAGQYTLKVFNMLGQEVATLLDRELPVGYHMVAFDASGLTSGIYIYRLSGNNIVMTKKMILSK